MLQRTLFPLPGPRRVEVTPEQRTLLCVIELANGRPLADLPVASRPVLRRLLAAGLVQCVTLGPAVYLLTPVGRVVRGRTR